MKFIFYTISWTFIVLNVLLHSSCSKADFISEGRPFTINVAMATDELVNNSHQARAGKVPHTDTRPAIILSENSLNDDYFIQTELEEIGGLSNTAHALKAKVNQLSVIRQPIQRYIRFRLAVYDEGGNFYDDKIYTINAAGEVTPDNNSPLTLDRGQYSFVAYSYNTTTAPSENLVGTTLADALAIRPTAYPKFMMFNSGIFTIGPNLENDLNIAFKYKFSPMTVIIDASATNGYEVSSIGGTRLSFTKDEASITLGSGAVSYGSSESISTITFPNAFSDVRTSDVTWMANNITNASLSIGSLRIGPLLQSTPIVLNNITIRPGMGYNLRVKILPNDRYETIAGEPAALINGRYWMRRNVGAAPVDPDSPDGSGSFQQLIGNYYQWGRAEVRATSYTGALADESPAWSSAASDGAWYSVTSSGGKVDVNDPCPVGWRVPTSAELVQLVQATTQLSVDNKGTDWTASATNYSTAKVFRSKRNKKVILTLPTGGYYDPARSLGSRGNRGYYWSSTETPSSSADALRMYTTLYNDGATISSGNLNRPYAFTVRCTQAVN